MNLELLVVVAILGCSGNDQPGVDVEAREPVADAPSATLPTQAVGEGSGRSDATESPTTDAPEADAPDVSAPPAWPGNEAPRILEKPAEPTPSDRKDEVEKDTP
jgi:hypothetical protein